MKKFSLLLLSLAISHLSFADGNLKKTSQNTLLGCAETQTLCFFENGKYLASPMGFKGDFFQTANYHIKKITDKTSEIQLEYPLPYHAFELFTRSNLSLKQGQFELTFERSKYDQDDKKDYYDTIKLLDNNNNPTKTITLEKSQTILMDTAQPIYSIILTKHDKATQQPLYTETYQLEKNTNDIVIKSWEIDEIFYRAKTSSATLQLIQNGSQTYLQDPKHKVKFLNPAQLGENAPYFEQFQAFAEQSDDWLYKNEAGNIHLYPHWDENTDVEYNYDYDEKKALLTHKNLEQYRKKFNDKNEDNSILKVYLLNTADTTKIYPITDKK